MQAEPLLINTDDAPAKGPSGQYLWTLRDIEHASWVLPHKAYEPTEGDENGED